MKFSDYAYSISLSCPDNREACLAGVSPLGLRLVGGMSHLKVGQSNGQEWVEETSESGREVG